MGISSLNFLQNLHSLEAEISTLIDYCDSPEECPELLGQIMTSIRGRINTLANLMVQFSAVSHQLQIVQGEGESQMTVNGSQYVTLLLVETVMVLLQRIILHNSGNLSLSRDLLQSLHEGKQTADPDFQQPSPVDNVVLLLDTVEKMIEQYQRQQASASQAGSKETSKEENK